MEDVEIENWNAKEQEINHYVEKVKDLEKDLSYELVKATPSLFTL